MDLDLFKIPKSTALGTSVILMEIRDAEMYFPGKTVSELFRIFKALGVPLLYVSPETQYFNLYTLERTIAWLLRTEGVGFAAWGSQWGSRFRHQTAKNVHPFLKIGEKEKKQISKYQHRQRGPDKYPRSDGRWEGHVKKPYVRKPKEPKETKEPKEPQEFQETKGAPVTS